MPIPEEIMIRVLKNDLSFLILLYLQTIVFNFRMSAIRMLEHWYGFSKTLRQNLDESSLPKCTRYILSMNESFDRLYEDLTEGKITLAENVNESFKIMEKLRDKLKEECYDSQRDTIEILNQSLDRFHSS
jgi:hypothetical protein